MKLAHRNPLDPIPTLTIDGEPHELAPPMPWYAWFWVGIPFALVPVGGALGAGIGWLAVMCNVLVFRSAENGFKRWGLPFAITGMAFVVAMGLATLVHQTLAG